MESQQIPLMIAIISILGNVIQYFLNKKNSDTAYMNSQLEYVKNVLKTQGEAYLLEKELHETQIKELNNKVEEQDKLLKDNKEEIKKLQKIVAKLIGNGCHIEDCPQRAPYTIEEINEITKNRKNEKNNIIH